MRYYCHFCGRSVSSELPDDAVLRALLVCPECISAGRVIIPESHIPAPPPQPGGVDG